MREAIAVELLKLRRSPVTWTASLLLILLIPALCLGMVSVVEGSGSGPLAEKVRGMVTGTGWDAYGGLLDQMAASALFVGVGVVVIWVFGREFTDRTVGSLFGLPVSRGSIALAKLTVSMVWSTVVSVALILVAAGIGAAAGLGSFDRGAAGALAGSLAVAFLTSLLASTLSIPASVGRGYLPGIGVMVLLLIAAQMAVLFDVGAWFPYAVPGLWAVSGVESGIAVGLPQLATVPILAGLAGLVTVRWWGRFELV